MPEPKTMVMRIAEQEIERALEKQRMTKEAEKRLQLVDRFLRKIMDQPVKVKGYNDMVVRDRISMWNGCNVKRPFDQPVISFGLYGQTGNQDLSYDAMYEKGIIRLRRGYNDIKLVTEEDVLKDLTQYFMFYGVPSSALEEAEIHVRKEWNDQAVDKCKIAQAQSRLHHTIAALSVEVALHDEFRELVDVYCDEGKRSFVDIPLAIRDIAVAVDKELSPLWETGERDFIIDMETVAATFVRGSLEEHDLISSDEVVRLMRSCGYEIYAGLKNQLASMTPKQLAQTVTVEINGEFYPIKQVSVVTGSDVLDDGHVVLKSENEDNTSKKKDGNNEHVRTLVKLAEEIRTHKGSTVGLQNKVFSPDFAASIEGAKKCLNK